MKQVFTTIILLLLVLSMLFGCTVQTTLESGATDNVLDTKVASTPVSETVEEMTEEETTGIDKTTIFTKNGVSLRVEELAAELNNFIVLGETTYSEICTFMKREGEIKIGGRIRYYWSFGDEGKIIICFWSLLREIFGYKVDVDFRVSDPVRVYPAESSDIDNRPSNNGDASSNVDPNIVFTEKGVSTRVEALAAQITIGQTRDEVYTFFGNSGKSFPRNKRIWDFGQEGKIMILFAQKFDENGKVYGDYLVVEVKTFPQYAWS